MPATDPSKALAREIHDLRRRLAAVERGSQASRRSLEVNGETLTLPQIASTSQDALSTGQAAHAAVGKVVIDAEAARLAAVEATTSAQQAATKADDAEAAALEAAGIAASAGKIVYTTSEPEGDFNTLWIPPPDNIPHRWDGDSWEEIRDGGVVSAVSLANQAVAAAGDAQAAADGKVRSFFQDTAPTGMVAGDVGDLWFQTNAGNKLSRWTGTAWVAADDTRIATAVTNAGSALSVANSKITTFYTSSTPTATATGDLWVDTGHQNQLKRWSGSAWVDARDASIATAQAAAVAAQSAADSAISKAADAQATADGKVTTYFAGTAPTGLVAADVGDLWFNTAIQNKLSRWSGTAWVAVDDTRIAAAVQAAADANTAAGNAQGTANSKIVTFYQGTAPSSTGRTTGDLWVDTANGNLLKRWSGTAWVDSRDTTIATAQSAANAAASAAAAADKKAADAATAAQTAQNTASAAAGKADTALTTAQGKNTVTYSLSVPNKTANPGIRIGDLWFQTDSLGGTVIGTWRWSGTDWTSAAFADSVLASLTVGKLVTGSIAAGQKIIAGGAGGTHAEMSDTGFRVFANNPVVGGAPSEVIRLGTSDDDYFAVVGADGRLRASVDSNGGGSFASLTTAQWPTINGADYTGRGGSLLEILDRRPRGLVGWGSDTGIYNVNTAAGRGIFDVSAKLYYGRMYKLVTRCRINGAVANDALAEVQIRYTWSADGNASTSQPAPAAPTINSPIAGRFQASTARPEAQGVYFEKLFSLGGIADGTYKNVRLLLCVARPVGSTTLQLYGAGVDATEMWVEDIGPAVTAAVTPNDGGGGATAPPPAAQAQRYTRSWVCDWHENYLPGGNVIALVGASQGHDPSNGNMRSYLGFSGPAADGSGLNITTALAGSVVESVSVYLYSWHWYYNSGGTALIGMHGFTSPPGAFGGGNEWMVGAPGFSKPGGQWVDLAPAGMANWANGTWKGIMLGSSAGADSLNYYGRFTDETDPNNKPVLTITYRK